MSRYAAMFERLAGAGEGAFGAFLMLGDPDLETSARLLDAAVEGGADMIEVGIPFSDPVADGPVIQAAAERARKQNVCPADALALLADFRRRHPHVPVGILTYANLVIARGRDAFCRASADAGADSLLVADVPAFEAEPFVAAARDFGLDPVLIAAANTPWETLERIARLGGGYVYCVARAGVTGVGESVHFDHRDMLLTLKAAGAPPPIFGFGISRPDHVRAAIDAGAAGAISGSAIVQLVAEDPKTAPDRVRRFVARMKAATGRKSQS
ncbi:MAG TPA: tryptophan synthase subunit alpha [Allosphingosinicella sp.]|nr:tryptophan synthase subunit alpha [Allosphingosinicella sp.]